MAYTWAKVYIEILDDHKMGMLPDGLWRRVIELILLAKKHDKDGYLPGMIEMSWVLRIPAEQLDADLGKLAEINIVQIKDGEWYLTNFVKRQAADPVTERVRNFRKRHGNEDVTSDVTQSYQTKTRLDTDTDKDTDIGAKAPAKPRKPRHTKDERTATAAIQACLQTAKRFPPIELYDRLIGVLGNTPEINKLAACRAQWLERGYNPNSWTWATEWYTNGVPSRNGSKPQSGNIDRATEKTRELLRQRHGNG